LPFDTHAITPDEEYESAYVVVAHVPFDSY